MATTDRLPVLLVLLPTQLYYYLFIPIAESTADAVPIGDTIPRHSSIVVDLWMPEQSDPCIAVANN